MRGEGWKESESESFKGGRSKSHSGTQGLLFRSNFAPSVKRLLILGDGKGEIFEGRSTALSSQEELNFTTYCMPALIISSSESLSN